MADYDTDRFPDTVPDECICAICHGVLSDARMLPCDHLFCRGCLEKWFEKRECCPTCIAEVNDTYVPHRFIQNILNQLRICCRFAECNQVVALDSIERHESCCDCRIVQCEHCKTDVLAKDLKSHEQACAILCEKCSMEVPYKQMSRHDCLVEMKKRSIRSSNDAFALGIQNVQGSDMAYVWLKENGEYDVLCVCDLTPRTYGNYNKAYLVKMGAQDYYTSLAVLDKLQTMLPKYEIVTLSAAELRELCQLWFVKSYECINRNDLRLSLSLHK